MWAAPVLKYIGGISSWKQAKLEANDCKTCKIITAIVTAEAAAGAGATTCLNGFA